MKMKKTLLFALALILVMALSTGCKDKNKPQNDALDDQSALPSIGSGNEENNDAAIDDDYFGLSATPLKWPTADLPPGFPKYSHGNILNIEKNWNGSMVYLFIVNTDKSAKNAYIKKLEAAGWAPPEGVENTDEEMEFEKGTMAVGLLFDEADEYVMLTVVDYETYYDVPE